MSKLVEIFWKSILKETLDYYFIKRDTCYCDRETSKIVDF